MFDGRLSEDACCYGTDLLARKEAKSFNTPTSSRRWRGKILSKQFPDLFMRKKDMKRSARTWTWKNSSAQACLHTRARRPRMLWRIFRVGNRNLGSIRPSHLLIRTTTSTSMPTRVVHEIAKSGFGSGTNELYDR